MESITVDEIIIQFAQEQKCLYDKTDKNFKDNQKKKNIWSKISENLRNLYCVDMSGNIFLFKNLFICIKIDINKCVKNLFL